MLCEIFKSKKKDETYIFVEKDSDIKKLPDELLKVLGELDFVMELKICEGRTLAREKPEVILANIEKQSFHLQMPPKI